LLVLCLLKSPLRLAGAALLAAAAMWAVGTPQPDILVAPNGEAFAIRTNSGRLAVLKTGSDTFAVQQWLAADADARSAKDKGLNEGMACDDHGCVGRLGDGAIVAIARTNAALEDDCRRAVLIVSARTVPRDCGALVIDRAAWERYGAIALRRVGARWDLTAARPAGYVRPWVHSSGRSEDAPAPLLRQPAPRDATPDLNDLEPGDYSGSR
jgi:competence protein ComEC